MRLRALVVLALLLVGPSIARRVVSPEPEPVHPRCASGVVQVEGRLACAPRSGAEVAGLAAWWMGTPLDLQRASAEDLEVVPGIGPKLAARIVEDRARRGGFRSVEDLQRVKGIGPKLSARLAEVARFQPSRQVSTSSAGISNR